MGPPSVVMPYKVQGPDPFPVRLPRQPLEIKHEYIIPDDTYYQKEPEFWYGFFEIFQSFKYKPVI